MERPILNIKNVIICGPSCSGKSSVARAFTSLLQDKKCPVNLVLSNTTRPMRVNEEQDIDYHFCQPGEFDNYDYLEQTCYRSWRYGVPMQNYNDNAYNVLVLNPQGLDAALAKLNKNNCMIVFLKNNLFVRLQRSVKREGCFKFEMFRRAINDTFDYWKFKKVCEKHKVIYNTIKNDNIKHTVVQVEACFNILNYCFLDKILSKK